jgi:hypothetical protein
MIAPTAEPRSRGEKAAATRPTDRGAAREEARRRRAERLDKPPTWRGAVNRAAIAAVIVAVLAVLALGNSPDQAIILAAVMLVVYIPLGYGFDTLVYRMRQRRKGRGTGAAPSAESARGRDARRG